MSESDNLYCDSTDIEVEKVTELELVFRMIGLKPYYEIKYKKVGENFYHIGYSSYDVETVLMYKEKYFEIVKKKPTNSDKIMEMSDEELATFLVNFKNTFGEEYEGEQCCLDWLQSEAE